MEIIKIQEVHDITYKDSCSSDWWQLLGHDASRRVNRMAFNKDSKVRVTMTFEIIPDED